MEFSFKSLTEIPVLISKNRKRKKKQFKVIIVFIILGILVYLFLIHKKVRCYKCSIGLNPTFIFSLQLTKTNDLSHIIKFQRHPWHWKALAVQRRLR